MNHLHVHTIGGIILSLFMTRPSAATPPDVTSPDFPVYVMNKIDDQYRGTKSHGVMMMTVKTAHFERTLTLESWTLTQDYSLMRILKPLKERGTATLKAKNDLYTYLNKTNRTIKITSAMMGGSWMGSHFTNDDLIRHTRLSRDFTISLDDASKRSDSPTYTFTLIPKKNAVVVWSKQVVVVRKKDLQPLKQIYFDEKQKPVRQLTFSDFEPHDGRIMPMKMVMKPLDGSNEYTMVHWKSIDFNIDLSPSFFSIQKLKSF